MVNIVSNILGGYWIILLAKDYSAFSVLGLSAHSAHCPIWVGQRLQVTAVSIHPFLPMLKSSICPVDHHVFCYALILQAQKHLSARSGEPLFMISVALCL